jgi:hypothetical protein
MNEFSNKIRKQIPNPYLAEKEKQDIYIEWLKKSIKKCDLIIKDFIIKSGDYST